MINKQEFQSILLRNIKLDTILLEKYIFKNKDKEVEQILKRIKTTVNLWLK